MIPGRKKNSSNNSKKSRPFRLTPREIIRECLPALPALPTIHLHQQSLLQRIGRGRCSNLHWIKWKTTGNMTREIALNLITMQDLLMMIPN